MTDIYVGVGHGLTDTGRYDPGAVHDGLVEHELAHKVADAYAAALARSGVTYHLEQDSGAGHDPNWVGSARLANALDVSVADEVHCNASVSHLGSGVEVIVHPATSEANKQACRGIAAGIAGVLGLPIRRDRGLYESSAFGFVRSTRMPAAIIEVAFLDHPLDRAAIQTPGALADVGEAIAAARCAYLGTAYVPPAPEAPAYRVAVVYDPAAADFDERVARALSALMHAKLLTVNRTETVGDAYVVGAAARTAPRTLYHRTHSVAGLDRWGTWERFGDVGRTYLQKWFA